jgi:hypothetical protein
MNYDHREPWIFKLFPVFFGITFLLVIGTIVFQAWVTVKVIEKPEIVGEIVGKVYNGFKEETGEEPLMLLQNK